MSQSLIDQYLEALADRNGGTLAPEAVIEAARPEDSPLHAKFTWDDDAAAHKQRLHEARALIRSVKVIIRTSPFIVEAPRFVRNPSIGNAAGYISLGRLATDEDAARAAVVAEFSRATAALARAKAVAAALHLENDITELENRLADLSERAASQVTA